MSGIATVSGSLTNSGNVTLTAAAITKSGTMYLINDELVLCTADGSSTTLTCTRGVGGTTAASHVNTTPIYEVVRAFHPGTSVEIYYLDSDITKIHMVQLIIEGPVVPQSAPAHLTDSSGGTPGATLAASTANLTDSSGGTPGTTIPLVRTDTAAHVAADAATGLASINAEMNARDVIYKNSIASLNAHINTLETALVAAGVFV